MNTTSFRSSTLPGEGRDRSLHRSTGLLFGNYLKTAMLLAGLTALLLWVGQALGGRTGFLFAGVFVFAMNFGSYWFSDKIALAMHGAKPLPYEQAPWLHDSIRQLAERAKMPMPRVFLMPSDQPNAFATGRNPAHAAVAVTDGLLRMLGRREIVGVMAHELAHVANRDTLISTIAATIAGVITHLAQMAFWFGGSLLSRNDDDEGGSPIAALGVALVAPFAAMLLQMAVSRSREYEADRVGAELLGDPDALASALAQIDRGVHAFPSDRSPATAHLFIANPLSGRGAMKLFSTHPPMEERIRRLREMARSL